MDLQKALETRRSIRKFKEDSVVSEAVIEEILRAAMSGPTAGNMRPWEFIIVKNKAVLNEVTEMRTYMTEMLENSDVMIIVVSNKNKEKYPDRWIQDCSVAVQNILLTLHSLGFGGSWQEIYPEEI